MKVQMMYFAGDNEDEVAVNLLREEHDVPDEVFFNGPSGFMLNLSEWNGEGITFDADEFVEDPIEPDVFTCFGIMEDEIGEAWKESFKKWCDEHFWFPDTDEAWLRAFDLLWPVEHKLGLTKGTLFELLAEKARREALEDIDQRMLANAI